MISESVVNLTPAPADEQPVFFEMNGLKAFVGPSEDIDGMSFSLQTLLLSAIDILQKDYEDLPEAHFGALYLLRQVAAGWDAMESMRSRAKRDRQRSLAAEAQRG